MTSGVGEAQVQRRVEGWQHGKGLGMGKRRGGITWETAPAVCLTDAKDSVQSI